MLTVYFAMDILLSFRTPYYYQGELHDSTKDMALRYAMSWFIPDALSCASLIQYVGGGMPDVDVDGDGSDQAGREASSERLAKLVRLMKLAKLLRLARLKRSLARLSDYAYEHLGGNLVVAFGALGSVVNLLLGFGLAMHLTGCLFYMLGNTEGGWVSSNYLPEEDPVMFDRYIESIFMISLADLPDETKANEEIFAIISVLVNGFVFGAIAATFSSIMVKLNEPCKCKQLLFGIKPD